ncbi:GCN5 family acetyltransferase [Pseudonocardia sp. EC080610-09]|uniref:GNAT family N-acetyltransferase n=1 Tax=unclassified Pseudonocardia TaxID=2619320 RepID=UPI0006CB7E64|nr:MULTISPECIES: GNAT family N-acetyltransferase [unclassified Pseudonocardia]ALE74448.1 GCN5 family acetyltransferase [Pseudonocardia sp. EC080625-04]ALL77870.1 GCN5 family acetyltransferase [Pseudonocardia sp. EC080610-09]ALL80785.1 GCN5 family acetyltransferase [Pseudonocardia sp. EC080619-01]
MATASVRPATDDDVDAVVGIQDRTWRTAYAGLLPEEAFASLTSHAARSHWRDAVHAGDDFHLFVAVEGAEAVGFCAAARYAGADGLSIAEISALLVEPRWGRRGHGGRLLAAAAAALRGSGSGSGRAWLPEADAASRGFYARAGWQPDGAVRTLDTGTGTLREIRVGGTLDLHLTG